MAFQYLISQDYFCIYIDIEDKRESLLTSWDKNGIIWAQMALSLFAISVYNNKTQIAN